MCIQKAMDDINNKDELIIMEEFGKGVANQQLTYAYLLQNDNKINATQLL